MTSLRCVLRNSSGLLVEAKTDAQKSAVTCPGHTAVSDRALKARFLEAAPLFTAAPVQVKRAPCSPEPGTQDPGCYVLPMPTPLVTQPAEVHARGGGLALGLSLRGFPPTLLLFAWANSFFRDEWKFAILFWKSSQVLSFQPLCVREAGWERQGSAL